MDEKQTDLKQGGTAPEKPEKEAPLPEEGRLRSHGPHSLLDYLGFLPDEKQLKDDK